jgi:hypothetical protein
LALPNAKPGADEVLAAGLAKLKDPDPKVMLGEGTKGASAGLAGAEPKEKPPVEAGTAGGLALPKPDDAVVDGGEGAAGAGAGEEGRPKLSFCAGAASVSVARVGGVCVVLKADGAASGAGEGEGGRGAEVEEDATGREVEEGLVENSGTDTCAIKFDCVLVGEAAVKTGVTGGDATRSFDSRSKVL